VTGRKSNGNMLDLSLTTGCQRPLGRQGRASIAGVNAKESKVARKFFSTKEDKSTSCNVVSRGGCREFREGLLPLEGKATRRE